jgi:hypothetical protein
MKKLILLSALFIFACSSDSEGNPCIYEPTLTTEAVTDITETSATLNGIISIVSENCDVPNNTEQGFVYSTEIQPTLEDTQVNVNGTNITTTIEGLEPNTTYYVRAFLTNTLGDFYGDEVNFMTSNDGGDNSSNYKLVDTISVSYEYDDTISGNLVSYEETYTYDYAGNKLLNISSSNASVNFTYNDNNQISTVYNPGFYVNEFEYDNQGRVSAYIYTEFDGGESTGEANFVYNQDGSVIQTWQGSQEARTYLFDDNGNIITISNSYFENTTTVKHYTFDNKNNPFKNITGNGFFFNFYIQPIFLNKGVSNNVLTVENENSILFYTYDDDDFPTNINSPNIFLDGHTYNGYHYNVQINITYTN